MKPDKWLSGYLALAKAIKLTKSQPAPDYGGQSGDRIIGVLPNELMKIWIAKRQLRLHILKSCKQVHPVVSKLQAGQEILTVQELEAMQKHMIGHERFRMLSSYFVGELMRVFPDASPLVLSGKATITVCNNWNVVLVPLARARGLPFCGDANMGF
jgi:hypothetical protein